MFSPDKSERSEVNISRETTLGSRVSGSADSSGFGFSYADYGVLLESAGLREGRVSKSPVFTSNQKSTPSMQRCSKIRRHHISGAWDAERSGAHAPPFSDRAAKYIFRFSLAAFAVLLLLMCAFAVPAAAVSVVLGGDAGAGYVLTAVDSSAAESFDVSWMVSSNGADWVSALNCSNSSAFMLSSSEFENLTGALYGFVCACYGTGNDLNYSEPVEVSFVSMETNLSESLDSDTDTQVSDVSGDSASEPTESPEPEAPKDDDLPKQDMSQTLSVPELIERTNSTVTSDGHRVTVSGLMPADVFVRAIPLEQDLVDEILRVYFNLSAGSPVPESFFAYDITLVNGTGAVFQPEEFGVSVSVSRIEKLAEETPKPAEVEVVHVNTTSISPDVHDEGKTEVKKSDVDLSALNETVMSSVQVDSVNTDSVKFTADSFSLFIGVMMTEQTGTPAMKSGAGGPIVFDLNKSSVVIGPDGYSGKDSANNELSETTVAGKIFEIMQTDNLTTSTQNNIIISGSADVVVYLNGVNVSCPTAAAMNVSATGITKIIFRNESTNTLKSGINFGRSTINNDESHAGLEKNGDGLLILSCEAASNGNLHNHICDENCGRLNAYGGSGAKFSNAAGIGSFGDGKGGSVIDTGVQSGTNHLHNLTILGGNIYAKGAACNYNDTGYPDTGGAGIGTGSCFKNDNISGTVTNLSIYGGNITAIGGGISAAGIGGGYRSGYVNLSIYGGKIDASVIAVKDLAQAPGIGGGGGGDYSAATAGATVFIYDGDITAESRNGAGIGGGGGGHHGSGMNGKVFISGGTIHAQSITGSAIGGGGSRNETGVYQGGSGFVNITGGVIYAESTAGSGIGGGGGGIGGAASLNISGGSVYASGIGGGSVKAGVGGAANLEISGGTITVTGNIGGGSSTYGSGGRANLEISGGTLTASGVGGGIGSDGVYADTTAIVTGGSVNTQISGTPRDASGNPVYRTIIYLKEGATAAAGTKIESGSLSSGTYRFNDVYANERGEVSLGLPQGIRVNYLVNGLKTYQYPTSGIMSGSSGSLNTQDVTSYTVDISESLSRYSLYADELATSPLTVPCSVVAGSPFSIYLKAAGNYNYTVYYNGDSGGSMIPLDGTLRSGTVNTTDAVYNYTIDSVTKNMNLWVVSRTAGDSDDCIHLNPGTGAISVSDTQISQTVNGNEYAIDYAGNYSISTMGVHSPNKIQFSSTESHTFNAAFEKIIISVDTGSSALEISGNATANITFDENDNQLTGGSNYPGISLGDNASLNILDGTYKITGGSNAYAIGGSGVEASKGSLYVKGAATFTKGDGAVAVLSGKSIFFVPSIVTTLPAFMLNGVLGDGIVTDVYWKKDDTEVPWSTQTTAGSVYTAYSERSTKVDGSIVFTKISPIIYDGQPVTAGTVDANDIIYSSVTDGVITVTWYNEDGTALGVGEVPKEVGSYKVNISAPETDNYKAVHNKTDFTILPIGITFDKSDGEPDVIDTLIVTEYDATSPLPQSEGETFKGWYYTDGTQVYNSTGNCQVDGLQEVGNHTLTALWNTNNSVGDGDKKWSFTEPLTITYNASNALAFIPTENSMVRGGLTLNITDYPDNIKAYDSAGKSVPLECHSESQTLERRENPSGVIRYTYTGSYLGDANLDYRVTIVDSACAGIDVLKNGDLLDDDELFYADVDGSGKANVADILEINKFLVGVVP